MEEDGTYVKPPKEKMGYATMVFVRTAIGLDIAVQLRKAVTIAVRYSASTVFYGVKTIFLYGKKKEAGTVPYRGVHVLSSDEAGIVLYNGIQVLSSENAGTVLCSGVQVLSSEEVRRSILYCAVMCRYSAVSMQVLNYTVMCR